MLEGGFSVSASIFFLLVVVALVGWMLWQKFVPPKGVTNINVQELEQLLAKREDCYFIDVRETHEYKAGHIRGMKNIPLLELHNRRNRIPQQKQIVLICRSGRRSRIAARMLAKQGFSRIANVRGGMLAWKGRVS